MVWFVIYEYDSDRQLFPLKLTYCQDLIDEGTYSNSNNYSLLSPFLVLFDFFSSIIKQNLQHPVSINNRLTSPQIF